MKKKQLVQNKFDSFDFKLNSTIFVGLLQDYFFKELVVI